MQTVSDDAGTAKNGTAFDKCTQGCLPVLVGGWGAWKPCLVPPFLVERHQWWMKILKFADNYALDLISMWLKSVTRIDTHHLYHQLNLCLIW